MKAFFDKLLGRKPRSALIKSGENVVTAPLSPLQLEAIRQASKPRIEPTQLIVASGQSVGKQRELNEDCLFTFTTTIAGNTGTQPLGLIIIADGMGGHQFGEVASNAAIRTFAGYILRHFHSSLFNLPTHPMEDSMQEIMSGAMAEAQRVVLKEAPGSGTTVTAALIFGQQVTIAHVGDSRGYAIYNDKRAEVITRDHSLVRRLEELGQITSAEAAVHPHRNVLYRALGQGETLEPEIFTMPFPPSGYIMLCSDGLWGVVPDEDMLKIISDANGLVEACQSLVAAANESGGPDNISVVIAQFLN